jgi:hypothetical protein
VKVIIINIQVKQMNRHLEINPGKHNGGAKQLHGVTKRLAVNCYNFESKYVKLEEG